MTLRPVALSLALFSIASGGHAQHEGSGHHHEAARADRPVPLYDNLGTHRYAVTTRDTLAQRYFDQGLRLLWAFNHAEAIRSFREAERRDPSCAMCPWGVAYAAGPNINAPMSPADADTALAAVDRAARLAGGASPREQALIAALVARYRGPGRGRAALDSSYAREIAVVATRFADDPEIRTLAADARMNLSPWNYWDAEGAARPGTEAVLQHLEWVIEREAGHPGACHLFIHVVEAKEPARGVPCAERLAQAMPGAGHLVHMPGHIYIRVGRYRDAIAANQHAVHADQSFLEGPTTTRRGIYASGYYPHNHHFLSFAASMMGASQLAIDHAVRTARAVDPGIASAVPWIEAITPIAYWTLTTFGRWNRILAEPLPPPNLRFATGMAYYARGTAFAAKRRFAEAGAALDSVGAIAANHPNGDNQVALLIAEHALRGEIALRRGRRHDAVRAFREAVRLEDGMPYTEPPTWYYPMRHSLGKALLAAQRYREAEQVYREDLARFPENGWSLYGLWQSLKKQGRPYHDVKAHFEAAWADADVRLRSSRF